MFIFGVDYNKEDILHGDSKDVSYKPERFKVKENENLVCKLRRACMM